MQKCGEPVAGDAAANAAHQPGKVHNFRDLAMCCEKVKAGVIFRSATPNKACGPDVMALMERHKIKTIVDFRDSAEAARDNGPGIVQKHFKEGGGCAQAGDCAAAEAGEVGSSQTKLYRRSVNTRRFVRSKSFDAGHVSRLESTNSDEAWTTIPEENEENENECSAEEEMCQQGVEVAEDESEGDGTRSASQPASGAKEDTKARQILRFPYAPVKTMRRVLIKALSMGELCKVGCFYMCGFCSCRPKLVKKARGEVLKKFNTMGLFGLNKIILEHSSAELCNVLKACTDPTNHPLLMHCSHGKDRTGLTAAIILTTIGVPRAEVLRDYEMSDEYGRSDEGRMRFVTEVPELDADEWCRAHPSTMSRTLDYINAHYGSIYEYLDLIGFDESWRERLRGALLRKEEPIIIQEFFI